MKMHIEYAADVIERCERQFDEPQASRYALESYADDDTVLCLVDSLDDEKASAIAETIKASRKKRYAKVTQKQRYAIASAILRKYNTAKAAYAESYGVSEEEFMSNAGK